MLGWLGMAGAAVLLAPGAGAAPAATVEIRTVTPPAASVDPGGRVTFVNKVDSYSTGVNLGVLGSFSATVNTDVAVTFFGQRRDLQANQSAAWNFSAPATTGSIAYTYRVVPAAGTPAAVVDQVVSTVAAGLPALPAPTPYVVQTIAPNVRTLPSVNLPQLPAVSVPAPPASGPAPAPVPVPVPTPQGDTPPAPQPDGTPVVVGGATGPGYTYGTGTGAPQMSPSAAAAAAAFDPAQFFAPGRSSSGAGSGGAGGSGGLAGSYDGASVPVFGRLAGLDGASLDETAAEETAASSPAAQALPAAALAAVVALAAVTAALVRTHQASRSSR
jgi:hypothetical protein